MTLAAGTRLGPYEVLSPLGAGGMGEVFRARDSRSGLLQSEDASSYAYTYMLWSSDLVSVGGFRSFGMCICAGRTS